MFGIWNEPGFHTAGAWIRDGSGRPLKFDTQDAAAEWMEQNKSEEMKRTGERGWPTAQVRLLPDSE